MIQVRIPSASQTACHIANPSNGPGCYPLDPRISSSKKHVFSGSCHQYPRKTNTGNNIRSTGHLGS
eukprot:5182829-Amphidinium_carterae.1